MIMTRYSNLLGQTLDGRYRIERFVGEGGQAAVFSGVDTNSGWKRAVKLLAASFKTPSEVIDRFRQESLLLANLPVHQNIVQVFDGGYDSGFRAFYIILELVSGVTLGDLIQEYEFVHEAREDTVVRSHGSESEQSPDDRTIAHVDLSQSNGSLGIPESVSIIRQVARALHHAHGRGIVHRDVKPTNILLSNDGQVKLTDFGIARDIVDTSLTVTGTAIGTLRYMSPEQVQDLTLDQRSDVYSLGIVFYECLTGRTPFADAARDLVPYHHVNTSPTPPRQINPSIPVQVGGSHPKSIKQKARGSVSEL